MTSKPVVPRSRAVLDTEEAVDHYRDVAGETVAIRFVDRLAEAYRHLGRFPAAGTSRYAHELDLPGLRAWPLRGFPFLVFYLERQDHVDVWRVLHWERDLPAWIRDTGPG